MAYAIKENIKCQAWELGIGSEMEKQMVQCGKIRILSNGEYELFSLEATEGKGQIAKAGDFFKVEYRGWPQPCERNWFLKNHKHIEDDWYEQVAKPLKIWRKDDPKSEEIRYLLDNGMLHISPEDPDKYFSASLWGTEETAASDATVVFYSVKKDENENITAVEFNFVDAEYFSKYYRIIKE
ncbi:MAG: hypothetical protein IKP88_15380 [Lachnospiraceae bacterium]|nr:hypothetical protein [Lachnospiraceae bacterium]